MSVWVNGVCVCVSCDDPPTCPGCIPASLLPQIQWESSCRLKENRLSLLLSSPQYSWQLFSQLSFPFLPNRIISGEKLPSEQKMLRQPVKVNSPSRYTHSAPSYMNMNIAVKHFAAIICRDPSGLTWWKISLRESEFNARHRRWFFCKTTPTTEIASLLSRSN